MLLWLFVIFAASCVCGMSSRVSNIEMESLQNLYDSTGGINWNYTSMQDYIERRINNGDTFYSIFVGGRHWNFAQNEGVYLEDPCVNASVPSSFMGLNCTCDTTSCSIIDLVLPSINLDGTLPPSLGNLSNLKTINFIRNNLKGEIPSSLGNLTQLTFIEMWENSLEGNIPPELGQLTQIIHLDLDDNCLIGSLPSELFNLTSLTFLNLYHNSLVGTIGEEIGRLEQLSYLALNNNHLHGEIPLSLSILTNLEIVYLYNNSLVGKISPDLRKLTKLVRLDLFGNYLTGSIPCELGELTNLEHLLLQYNQLTGEIPASLGNLTNLVYLMLDTNYLIGEIPVELSKLTRLTQLHLHSNELVGSVPSEFSNLGALKVLLLQNNSLANSPGSSAFTFINEQANLTTLDVSGNEFIGVLSETIFRLPNLRVLSAGDNCFSGSLPSNLCDATLLETIALSGMTSATSCRHYYWENSPFSSIFDGFGAKHFMQGSLPQCVYTLPNLITLHVAGNLLAGSSPFSGDGNEELVISPLLYDLNIAGNKLFGTISSQLMEATTDNGTLRFLDMSYNRISGNLGVFSGNKGKYFNPIVNAPLLESSSSFLALEVNRLSGAVPSPLQDLLNVKILTGNVFSCSVSRDDLPVHDYPAVESYQCGSTNFNNMLIAFGAVIVFIVIVIQVKRHKTSILFVTDVMKKWLHAADGQDRELEKYIKIVHMKRYSDYLRDLRWFAMKIGVALTVVFIIYCCMSDGESRTVEHAYTWITTAAYLTGVTPTVLLLIIGICMTFLTWYLVLENKWDHADVHDVYARDVSCCPLAFQTIAVDHSWCMWIQVQLFPMFRIIVLLILGEGVLLVGNAAYLYSILNGNPANQFAFKLGFALFKIVWSMWATPKMFDSELFFFGLDQKYHKAFVDYWFGGRLKLMSAFQNFEAFWIPVSIVLITTPDCFVNAFYARNPYTFQFNYHACYEFNSDGTCYDARTFTVTSPTVMPFVYNSTCSHAIIRDYVPLFLQSFLLLIARSALQLLYLSWEIHDVESPLNEELLPAAQEQEPDQEDGQGTEIVKRLGNCWGCIADKWDRPWWKNKFAEALRLPHKHLLYNSTQRKASYIPESSLVFSSRPSEWITSGIPYRLGALVTLLTFGVMAPVLAMVIILYLILDSYVTQLVLGRFIVTEIGNLQEYTRDLSRDKHDSAIDTVSVLETIYMSHVKKNRMKVDIYDAVKDWGARKVLEEVENQCRYVPASALSLSRRSFVIIPAIAMSFLMNDVINSASNSAGNHIWWPSLTLMIFACGIELLTHAATYCYSPVPFQSATASATASASASESASISLGAMKAGNPIHFNAL